jgi:hypothetical protein
MGAAGQGAHAVDHAHALRSERAGLAPGDALAFGAAAREGIGGVHAGNEVDLHHAQKACDQQHLGRGRTDA